MAQLVLVSELPGAGGAVALAAGCAVAMARATNGAVLLAEVGDGRSRGPTMLAAEGARELESGLRDAGFECAARGRLAWLRIAAEADWP